MLVGLDNHLQHISGFSAGLVDQLVSNVQNNGESSLSNTVQLLTLVSVALEAVGPANRQQALNTGVNGLDVVGVQQIHGDVHVLRPSLGEIVVENLGDQRNELLTDVCGGGSEGGDETVAENSLLLLGDCGHLRVLIV